MNRHQTACRNLLLKLVLLSLLVLAISPGAAIAAHMIATGQGFIQGVETPSLEMFLGVPYAAAPVGDLRWKPPAPHSNWSGVLDATKFGSHCAQIARVVGTPSSDEDCLFLNVYVPRVDSSGLRPDASVTPANGDRGRAVMVWISWWCFHSGRK